MMVAKTYGHCWPEQWGANASWDPKGSRQCTHQGSHNYPSISILMQTTQNLDSKRLAFLSSHTTMLTGQLVTQPPPLLHLCLDYYFVLLISLNLVTNLRAVCPSNLARKPQDCSSAENYRKSNARKPFCKFIFSTIILLPIFLQEPSSLCMDIFTWKISIQQDFSRQSIFLHKSCKMILPG